MIIQAIKRIMQKHETPPELHTCPHCGAGLTRLYKISGGIMKRVDGSIVRMKIGCRDCNRSHRFKGTGIKAHWLALQLENQTAMKKKWWENNSPLHMVQTNN